MKIDELSINIIKEFYNLKNKEEITTWELSKRIFPLANKIERRRKEDLIKKRIQRMPELFKIKNENNKLIFELLSNNILFKKAKFEDEYKDAVYLKINNKWQIHEI